jgi:hypothetical protein
MRGMDIHWQGTLMSWHSAFFRLVPARKRYEVNQVIETNNSWIAVRVRGYGVQYAYLIFDLFLSYSIQVEMIDIFPPGSKIFNPPLPQLPGFPLGVMDHVNILFPSSTLS